MHRPAAKNPPFLRNPLLRAMASAVEPFYRGIMAVRNLAFATGLRRRHPAPLPVVSIGNLTAGGTGKTPMVVHVCQTFESYGIRPAVVMRGYRRDSDGRSDEEDLLKHLLPGITVVANPDRVAGARSIPELDPKAGVIVLDDGFQHRRLRRDLDIVLIDATNPFGYEHVLPRGTLREGRRGLRRADGVVLTRADLVAPERIEAIEAEIERFHGRRPVGRTTHTWVDIADQDDRPVTCTDARVFVVAGIGNPDAFLEQVAARFTIVQSRILPDHADYNGLFDDETRRMIRAFDPDAILTTEKDWVKIRRLLQSASLPVPVWRPRLSIAFLDGERKFTRMLISSVGAPSAHQHESTD